MMQEEWFCESCGSYFDNLDPAEGKTCAFCGSKKIKLWDGECADIVNVPICFLTNDVDNTCHCVLFDICMKYKDTVFSKELRMNQK